MSTHKNVAAHLIKLHSEAELNLSNILKLISSDPVLTAQILFIANNHYLNSEQQVNSVEQATVVLSFPMISELVLSLCFLSIFEHNNQHNYIHNYWMHSLYTAVAMKVLADNFDSGNANFLYTAGLLHDIGKRHLHILLGEEYTTIIQTSTEQGISLQEQEKKILGIDHSEVGAHLLKHWKLPENIINIVKYHHLPEHYSSGSKLDFWIRLVYMGNLVAHSLEDDRLNYADLKNLDQGYKDYFSISEDGFDRIIKLIKKELQLKQQIIKILGN
jgi:putative nucleotidyltransferase with HDIG domain